MALPVTVTISCGGTPLAKGDDYFQLTLNQDLFGVHVLTITAPFDRVESSHTPFFAKAPDRLLGQPVTAEVVVVKGFLSDYRKPLLFKGFVTSLSTEQDSDRAGSVQVTVHSATYLLTDGLQRRTFRQKTLHQIFSEVLQPYDVPCKLQPQYAAPLPYVAQYQENNFEFLSRLAATYGEWFYSDGRTLYLGPPSAGAEIDFAADGVHNRFSFGLALRPAITKLYGYDYRQHQHTSADTTGLTVTGLQGNKYGRVALDQSDKLFSHPAHAQTELPDPTAARLEAEAQRLKGQFATGLVTVQGQSEDPALTLGAVISIHGKGLGSEHNTADNFGTYRLTALTHAVDQRGNYQNTFTAIPHLLDEPPIGPYHHAPAGTAELALVIDVRDPENLGRIRVRYFWPVERPQDAETDWLRVLTPYSGEGKGQLFTPELNSQVLIGYTQGLAEQPYVLGNLFHGRNDAAATYTHNGGEIKGIQTKAGNKITFHDQKGAEKILISNGRYKETALEITFKDGGLIELKTKGDISLAAGKNVTIQAGENVSIEAGQNMTLKADDLTTDTNKNTNIKANAKLNVVGSSGIKMKGKLKHSI
jgi:type VI secretion system secreted protein VgrG